MRKMISTKINNQEDTYSLNRILSSFVFQTGFFSPSMKTSSVISSHLIVDMPSSLLSTPFFYFSCFTSELPVHLTLSPLFVLQIVAISTILWCL